MRNPKAWVFAYIRCWIVHAYKERELYGLPESKQGKNFTLEKDGVHVTPLLSNSLYTGFVLRLILE